MWSRSLTDCTPELADLAATLRREFERKRVPFFLGISRTAVSLDVQEAIRMQGRETLSVVNAKRQKSGLWLITPKENVEVTWTDPRSSLHVVAPGLRDKAEAVDFMVMTDPDGPGPLKPIVAPEDEGQYRYMGALAVRMGLEWGGNFRNAAGKPRPDWGHVQLRKIA